MNLFSGNGDNAFRAIVRRGSEFASPSDLRDLSGWVPDEAWFFGEAVTPHQVRLKEAIVVRVNQGFGGHVHQSRGNGVFSLVYHHSRTISAETPPRPVHAGRYVRYPYHHQFILDKIIYDERGFLAVDCGEGRQLPLREFPEGTTWVETVGGEP